MLSSLTGEMNSPVDSLKISEGKSSAQARHRRALIQIERTGLAIDHFDLARSVHLDYVSREEPPILEVSLGLYFVLVISASMLSARTGENSVVQLYPGIVMLERTHSSPRG